MKNKETQPAKTSFLSTVKSSFQKGNNPKQFPWFSSGLILIGFALGVLTASSVDIISRSTRTNSESSTDNTVTDAEQCREKGGRYDKENSTCILVTDDKGDGCSSNADCEGWCLADSNAELNSEDTGSCSDSFRKTGCFKFIDEGKVSSICMPE